jgi:hypothetical protein
MFRQYYAIFRSNKTNETGTYLFSRQVFQLVQESFLPAYVARRAGTKTLFLLSSLAPIACSKIPAQLKSKTPDMSSVQVIPGYEVSFGPG